MKRGFDLCVDVFRLYNFRAINIRVFTLISWKFVQSRYHEYHVDDVSYLCVHFEDFASQEYTCAYQYLILIV